MNDRRISRSPAALLSEYQQFDRWAIVIGISEYKDAAWNLKYADRDAEAFCEMLQTENGGAFKPEHIHKLTNEAETTRNITKALRSFLQKPARKDQLGKDSQVANQSMPSVLPNIW